MKRDGRRSPLLVLLGTLPLFWGCAAARLPRGEPSPSANSQGFTAEYRLFWRGPGGVRRVRLAAAYRRPGKLRLELLDPFGASRAVLVASADGGMLLDPLRKEFRAFPRGREALRALSGLNLEADLLASILLGNPTLAPGMICSAAGAEGTVERRCEGPGGEPSLRVIRQGRDWHIQGREAPDLRVRLSFGGRNDARPPERLRVGSESNPRLVELRLVEFHGDPPAPELYSLQAPPSFRDASADPLPEGKEWIQP